MNEHRTFRVRTEVGKDGIINVPINQTFDTIDILSLKISQKNAYKLYDCGYGIIVGRVIANKGFGIPNAKISIFIPMENSDDGRRLEDLYNFSMTNERGEDGKMYNLLPEYVDKVCHQDVGSFYNKRFVLDNEDVIEVFEKYYKYTTTSNQSGDYMIYGVPTGSHLLHVDIDLSDIGILSQAPRDMVYQNFSLDMFDSPTKFKKDSNLNTLAQIKRQTKSVFVQPFWGDTTEASDTISIVRCDIDIDYKFISTCVFLGSVITDTGEESINKNCRTTKDAGRMDKLTTGPGMIEMIRLNERGGVEQATVNGEKLIDENGVWCYQIPMNLDYVKTDEFGKMVPSDNPEMGIATRAEVRFRISMDDFSGDGISKKRARYLVPNNPELYSNDRKKNEDCFAFGTKTDSRDFRNLYWNCVYTVKSYIPRLQKSKNSTDRKFTGIKAVNRPGDNNPMPYNFLSGKMTIQFTILCALLKFVIKIVATINNILSLIALPAYAMYKWFANIAKALKNVTILKAIAKIFCACQGNDDTSIPVPDPCELPDCDPNDPQYAQIDNNVVPCGFGEGTPVKGLCFIFYKIYEAIGCGIGLDNFCDNGVTYFPGCTNVDGYYDTWANLETTKEKHAPTSNDVAELFNCMENKMAEDNEIFSFNFGNDWVNGVLYFPLWFRFIKKKKKYLFGQIEIPGVDRWCNFDETYKHRRVKLYKTCSLNRTLGPDDELVPIEEEDINLAAIYDLYLYLTLFPPGNTKVYIGYDNTSSDKTNCYGFKCIKSAASCVNGLPGFIKQKKAIENSKDSEYVYYYCPGKPLWLKNDIDATEYHEKYVKMFSNDIVLLGSLHDCDPQGIPQFFKNLTSTTYNMPPNMVVNDGDEDTTSSGGNEKLDNDSSEPGDVFIPGTEYTYQTGADWGERGYRQCKGPDQGGAVYNFNDNPGEKYSDGGLFYGITCSNIYTKPKTCINLERVCEYGVSPDLVLPILVNGQEKNLLPDGYISYDDIIDNEGRTDFATMNSNNLRTRINPETGYKVYDFNPYYIDNFDGSLYNLMKQTDCKCNSNHDAVISNYYYNYMLENNNYGYSRFRYGSPINLLGFSRFTNDDLTNIMNPAIGERGRIKMNNGFISTKNSFYFYFGLKFGKTAIDKFFTNYYSPCDVDESTHPQIEVEAHPNSLCNDGDGFVTIFISSDFETPYSIVFTAENDLSHDLRVDNLTNKKIYFGSFCQDCQDNGYIQVIDQATNLPIIIQNDVYNVEIIDANNIVVETFRLNFTGGASISDIQVVTFSSSYSSLYSNNETYNQVASDNTRYTNNPQTGGYAIINYPTNSETGVEITNYKFELLPYNQNDFPQAHETVINDVYSGYTFICLNGQMPSISGCFFDDNSNDKYFVVGVPKPGVKYIIRFTEMCGQNMTDNVYETVVKFVDPKEMEMTINNINYNILKNFSTSAQINAVEGWLDMSNINIDHLLEENPLNFYGTEINMFIDAMSVSKYTTSSVQTKYNFSDECVYDLSIFFKNCILTENSGQPLATQASPERVLDVDTSNTIVTSNDVKLYVKGYDPINEVYFYDEYANTDFGNYLQDYYENQLTFAEQLSLIRSINNVIKERMDVAYKVRSAFYTKNDYDNGYMIKIGYSGGVPIIKHYIKYSDEDGNGGLLNDSVLQDVDVIINGMKVPTISEDTSNMIDKYATFTVINGIQKNPYEFGIKDSLNAAVPQNFSVNGTNLSNQFYAHMIEKPLDYEFETWSSMTNFPNMENPVNDNEFISCDGFIGIKIKNGIARIISYEPVFDTCTLNVGSDADIKFQTIIPGSCTSINFNNSWSLAEVESRPGTERVSYCEFSVLNDATIENYSIRGVNNEPSAFDGSNFYPLKNYFSAQSSFVFNDGREGFTINIFPTSEVNFKNDECVVEHYDMFGNHHPYINFMFNCTDGFTPSNIFCFSSSDVTYPLSHAISYANKLDIGNDASVMMWDKYGFMMSHDLIITDSNMVSRISNGTCIVKFKIPIANGMPKIFFVCASGDGAKIKRSYVMSHLIDTAILTYNTLGPNAVNINLYNSGYGYYVTRFDFTAVIKDSSNFTVYEESFPAQGQFPFTLSFTNHNISTGETLWIRDISGVLHEVIPTF